MSDHLKIPILLVLLPFLFVWSEARALPLFARQTNLPCQTCHNTQPRLNATGMQFYRNGFRFGGSEEKTALEKTFSPVTPEERHLPFAVVMMLKGVVSEKERSTKMALHGYMAGSLSSWSSIMVKVNVGQTGKQGGGKNSTKDATDDASTDSIPPPAPFGKGPSVYAHFSGEYWSIRTGAFSAVNMISNIARSPLMSEPVNWNRKSYFDPLIRTGITSLLGVELSLRTASQTFVLATGRPFSPTGKGKKQNGPIGNFSREEQATLGAYSVSIPGSLNIGVILQRRVNLDSETTDSLVLPITWKGTILTLTPALVFIKNQDGAVSRGEVLDAETFFYPHSLLFRLTHHEKSDEMNSGSSLQTTYHYLFNQNIRGFGGLYTDSSKESNSLNLGAQLFF